ncbi:rhamnogalacturonan endolyase [Sarracenia purpurea var. burkii]
MSFLPLADNTLNCRKINDNTYQGTTWQIKFKHDNVDQKGTYKLRVAVASATLAELQCLVFNSVSVRLVIRLQLVRLVFRFTSQSQALSSQQQVTNKQAFRSQNQRSAAVISGKTTLGA